MKEDLTGKVVNKTYLMDGSEGLPLREYKVRVLIVPPNYEIALGISQVREELKTIKGYSLKDAKRKAGIA